MKEKVIRAVWAVDPYESKLKPDELTMSQVRHFMGDTLVRVRPVVIDFGGFGSEEEIQAAVQDYLRPTNSDHLPEIEILTTTSFSRSNWAENLMEIAARDRAEVVILTSHGRSQIGAFFLGSLSRELLQLSSVPLLFLAPPSEKARDSKKVLFATDLTEPSWKAYQKFLKFIKGKVHSIILFHAADFPVVSMASVQTVGMTIPFPESARIESNDWTEKELEKWQQAAGAQGLTVEVQRFPHPAITGTASTIQEVADKENVSLIGVVSHAGAVEKVLLGSVTSALMSSQKCNLWVCGPKLDA